MAEMHAPNGRSECARFTNIFQGSEKLSTRDREKGSHLKELCAEELSEEASETTLSSMRANSSSSHQKDPPNLAPKESSKQEAPNCGEAIDLQDQEPRENPEEKSIFVSLFF
jgi:hypothetical protein